MKPAKKPISKSSVREAFRTIIWPRRKLVLVGLVLIAVSRASAVVLPLSMKTLVDESLTEDEQIVFEGNNHHEAYRINFADFQRLEQHIVAAFAAAV